MSAPKSINKSSFSLPLAEPRGIRNAPNGSFHSVQSVRGQTNDLALQDVMIKVTKISKPKSNGLFRIVATQ